MRVLEVYPFGRGLGQAFREHGHEVFVVDFKERPKVGQVTNAIVSPEGLAAWVPPAGPWDVALLRPFCTTYSRASFYKHYRDNITGQPLTAIAREADEIVCGMLRIKDDARPRLGWILENPNGSLRKCAWMKQYPVSTVTLCQYGETYRKATDLFGKLPPGFAPRACKTGAPCHEKSVWSKGDGVATVGDALKRHRKSPFEKAFLPFQLSLELCEAFEESA